ncbi:MAG: hypothetical protein AAFY22_10730 [Pseudomonadota bacterium]
MSEDIDIAKTDEPSAPNADVVAGGGDKKRRQRNIAIALMIAGFVLLVYVVTIMRLGGAVAERSF